MDRNRWNTVGKLVVSLIAAGVLAAGVAMPVVLGAGLFARNEAARFLDTTCDLQESAPPQKTTLYARDGKTVIAELFTQDRQPVPLTDVPTFLQDALVATEDRRFYSHHGVDLRGLIRSAVNTGSGDTQGGSTLTMQYVKQIRYFQAGDNVKLQQAAIAQNLQRKIEDAKCALYFEGTKHESKPEILDNYLNIAFFGEHAYGIQTAAETYFGVPAKDLTLAQSAMLVGLLRAPSSYDPYNDLQAATSRRNEVLQNLVAVGQLTQTQANQAEATPIKLATDTPPVVQKGCANADDTSVKDRIPNVAFFCEYAQSWLENVNGLTPTQLNTGGLKIVTTLDPQIQKSMQINIAKAVPATAASTAVMPAIDPATGDVLAMAASKTYGSGKGQTEQPIFTSDTANGASTFKLFPLLTALQTGIPDSWQLSTVGNTGTYMAKLCAVPGAVRNGDANESYNTVESLRDATAKSDNSYYVKLAEQLLQCKLQPIVNMAENLGMSGFNLPSPQPHQTWAQEVVNGQYAQQLVLGSIPTSPLELAGAYAAVANHGTYNAPSPILSIQEPDGNAIAVKRTPSKQVVDAQTAAKAENILEGDTQGSGTSAGAFSSWYSGSNKSVIASKTGTNEAAGAKNGGKNAAVWFVGLTDAKLPLTGGGTTQGLASTTGLINFDTPTVPSTGLPTQKAGEAYGSYAASVWLKALGPTLTSTTWKWPNPDNVPGGGAQVPSQIVGMSVSDARKVLQASGFQMRVLGQQDGSECASNEPLDSVAYYGPTKAAAGSTVTVCMSSSITNYSPPIIYTPPAKTTKPKTKPPGGGTGGTTTGGGRSGGTTGGGTTGGATGGTTGGTPTGGTTGGGRNGGPPRR